MSEQAEQTRTSYEASWSVLGSMLTLVVGTVPNLLGAPGWVPNVVAAGLVVTVMMVASRVVYGARLFADRDLDWRIRVVRWIGVAALAYWGWVLAFTLAPGWWFWWLLALASLGGGVYGFCRLHPYLLGSSTPVAAEALPLRPATDETSLKMTEALMIAKRDYVKVLKWEPVSDEGRVFAIRFTVRVSFAGRGDSPTLSPRDAEFIALALVERTHFPLNRDWVQIRELPTAGTYTVVVAQEDVMGKVRPYIDDPTPTSIREPAMVGYTLDLVPQHLLLTQHSRHCGASGVGKSSLVNVEWAHATRCPDAVVWVCGTQKLYEMLSGWLEPYRDTDLPLPFDWIASGMEDTLAMLIGAMSVARWRQRQPHPRPKWPALLVYLDEGSFVLPNRTVRGAFEGEVVTASAMGAMLTKGAKSALVYFKVITQRSTDDHGGEFGADIRTNAGYTACFASDDWQEVGRMMGDYQLPQPSHNGEYWLRVRGKGVPVQILAPYIQEIDVNAPRLHDGPTVSDVAWARRTVSRLLDPGSAQAAGPVYARRHTRMNDELFRYLGESGPGAFEAPVERDGFAEATTAIDALMAASGGGGGTASVTTLTSRRTVRARIIDILDAADEPLEPAAVVAALAHDGGEAVGDQVVANTLSRLVADGDATRPVRGLYAAPDTESDLTSHSSHGELTPPPRPGA